MKLSGFYRLMTSFPTPVIPLFEKEDGGIKHAQVLDGKGYVEGFQKAVLLEKERMILAEGQYSQTTLEIGRQGLYALAYSENHVLINTSDVVKRDIREYLYDNRQTTPPFAALDLAQFLGDASLIEETAERCRLQLSNTAPSMLKLWIDGSPLAEELKWKLRNRQVNLEGSTPPKPGSTRLGLIGPYKVMSGITDFCVDQKHSYRAEVVRRLLGQSDSSKRMAQAAGRIDEVIDDLARYYAQTQATGKDHMFSRARIVVQIFDTSSYIISRENFCRAVRQSQYYRTLSSLLTFTRGKESSNFILLLCMLLEYEPEFRPFFQKLIGDKALG